MAKDHVLLAATNHEHLLDPAIWRRFTYKLKLSEPSRDLRTKMIGTFFGAFADAELVEILADLTEGLTGSQLRHIAEHCVRSAVLADKSKVSLSLATQASFVANPKISGLSSLPERLRAVKNINRKTFTQMRLAEMFNISQPLVSKLLKEAS